MHTTAELNNGCCVPCYRNTLPKRLWRGIKALPHVMWFIVTLPIRIAVSLIGYIKFECRRVPFSKLETIRKLSPPLSRSNAKAYYRGLKETYLSGKFTISGMNVYLDMGYSDGLVLRETPDGLDDLINRMIDKSNSRDETP